MKRMPPGTYKTYREKRLKRDKSPRRIPIGKLSPSARQEKKFLDTIISTTIDSTTEVINTSLCQVVQGDTASTRDGNIIVIESIELQGRLAQVPGAAAVSAPIVYIWLVLDRQADGAAMSAIGNSLSYLTSASGGNAAHELLPVPGNQWTYKTLKKWAIPLNSQAGVTTAYNNRSVNFHYFKKFKNGIEIRFNGNAGTISDIMSNNLALVAGCADTDDTVSFVGTARIRFTG